LTQDSNIDTTEAVDESSESAVIRALRKQIKDIEAELKGRPDRPTLEAEIRESLKRDNAIEGVLTTLGHPAGILDVVKAKLGDAEVTRDSVADALRGIGYQVEVDDAPAGEGHEPSESESDLAKVASLSAQVRSAAQGVAPVTDIQRINQAQSQAELNAIMAELGLAQ
jgi:hypothetical protein